MMRKGDQTCSLKYNGPHVAIISIDEDCVYTTHMESSRDRIGFAVTQKCSISMLYMKVYDHAKSSSM